MMRAMAKNKPLLRAQFYHDSAKTLRDHAAIECDGHRRKILSDLADYYEEAARELIAEGRKVLGP